MPRHSRRLPTPKSLGPPPHPAPTRDLDIFLLHARDVGLHIKRVFLLDLRRRVAGGEGGRQARRSERKTAAGQWEARSKWCTTVNREVKGMCSSRQGSEGGQDLYATPPSRPSRKAPERRAPPPPTTRRQLSARLRALVRTRSRPILLPAALPGHPPRPQACREWRAGPRRPQWAPERGRTRGSHLGSLG